MFSSIVYKNNVDVLNKGWDVSGNTSIAVFSKCTDKKTDNPSVQITMMY